MVLRRWCWLAAAVLVLVLGALAGGASARPYFSLPNFCNHDSLIVNGKVSPADNRMLFDTDASASFFFKHTFALDDKFKLQFAFTVPLASEGFALVLQSVGTDFLGHHENGGIGYDRVHADPAAVTAIAFEFDTRQTVSRNDPQEDHISVHFPKAGQSYLSADELTDELNRNKTILLLPRITLGDGFEHVFTLTFSGKASEFLLDLDGTSTLRTPYPLVHSEQLYAGFTSGGSGVYQINSFSLHSSASGCAPGFTGANCDIDETASSPLCAEASNCEQCVVSPHCCAWCTGSELCGAVRPALLNNQSFDATGSSDESLPQIKTSWCTFPVHIYRCKSLEFPSVFVVALVIGSIGVLICCWFSYLLKKRREEDAKLAKRMRIGTQPRMVNRRRRHASDDDEDGNPELESDPEDPTAELQSLTSGRRTDD